MCMCDVGGGGGGGGGGGEEGEGALVKYNTYPCIMTNDGGIILLSLKNEYIESSE